MNKELRHHYICNRWSESAAFLEYLRYTGRAFKGLNNNKEPNIYWYGSIVCFVECIDEIKKVIKEKSVKESRLKEYAQDYKDDMNSPVLGCVAFCIEQALNG